VGFKCAALQGLLGCLRVGLRRIRHALPRQS
jgi:hypothetical protein